MNDADRTRYLAPALTRGLDVIELLSDYAEGLTAAQISQALDLTTSQLFRILTTLEHRRFIARTLAGDRYHCTFRLFTIAHRHAPVARLLPAAGPLVRALSRRTRQAVLVSVRDGVRMVAVSFVPAPASVSLLVPVGQGYELLPSSAGLFHFARERPETRAALLAEVGAAARTEHATRIARAEGELQLADCLVEPSRDMSGVTNITTVVRDAADQPIASLSIPWVERPDAPLGQAEAAEALREAAAELERALSGAQDLTDE
jgi:DNA-binding IclR family transcriptional regulator